MHEYRYTVNNENEHTDIYAQNKELKQMIFDNIQKYIISSSKKL